MRCELLQGVGEPFDGKPEFFNQWYTTLTKRIAECGQECDNLDAINIIIANTTGDVKNTVKKLLSAGISNPDHTLRQIWEIISDRFGSTEDLSDSLILQLESIKPVNSVYDIRGLHNILDTCAIVEAHMLDYPDLRYLNFKPGLSKVVGLLPDKICSKWKERSFKHKITTGLEVDFAFFIDFLSHECKFWRSQLPSGSCSKNIRPPQTTATFVKKQYKT